MLFSKPIRQPLEYILFLIDGPDYQIRHLCAVVVCTVLEANSGWIARYAYHHVIFQDVGREREL